MEGFVHISLLDYKRNWHFKEAPWVFQSRKKIGGDSHCHTYNFVRRFHGSQVDSSTKCRVEGLYQGSGRVHGCIKDPVEGVVVLRARLRNTHWLDPEPLQPSFNPFLSLSSIRSRKALRPEPISASDVVVSRSNRKRYFHHFWPSFPGEDDWIFFSGGIWGLVQTVFPCFGETGDLDSHPRDQIEREKPSKVKRRFPFPPETAMRVGRGKRKRESGKARWKKKKTRRKAWLLGPTTFSLSQIHEIQGSRK